MIIKWRGNRYDLGERPWEASVHALPDGTYLKIKCVRGTDPTKSTPGTYPTIDRIRETVIVQDEGMILSTARAVVEPPAVVTLPLDSPVAALREAAGLSLADVGAALECSRANVTQTEGRGDGVSISALRRFADACGYEVEITARRKR